MFQKIKWESLGRTLHSFQKQPLATEPSEPQNSGTQKRDSLCWAMERMPASTETPEHQAGESEAQAQVLGSGELPDTEVAKNECSRDLFFPNFHVPGEKRGKGTKDALWCKSFAFPFMRFNQMMTCTVQQSTHLTEEGGQGWSKQGVGGHQGGTHPLGLTLTVKLPQRPKRAESRANPHR